MAMSQDHWIANLIEKQEDMPNQRASIERDVAGLVAPLWKNWTVLYRL
jgi:hypothetical protein